MGHSITPGSLFVRIYSSLRYTLSCTHGASFKTNSQLHPRTHVRPPFSHASLTPHSHTTRSHPRAIRRTHTSNKSGNSLIHSTSTHAHALHPLTIRTQGLLQCPLPDSSRPRLVTFFCKVTTQEFTQLHSRFNFSYTRSCNTLTSTEHNKTVLLSSKTLSNKEVNSVYVSINRSSLSA